MGVPPDITKGSDGADDVESWNEAYNSKGPETKVSGLSEQLSNNPGGLKKGTGSSQSFNVVEAEGDDLIHSDGKTARKPSSYSTNTRKWKSHSFWQWDSSGHCVPLVAPKKYFDAYPLAEIVLPKSREIKTISRKTRLIGERPTITKWT